MALPPTNEIVRVGLQDLQQLQAIARTTFFETYAEFNTSENMRLYLENDLGLPKLQEELSDGNAAFFFYKSQEVMGFLKINYRNCCAHANDSESGLEVERIYVLKEQHGKGIGRSLLQFAENLAKQKNCSYCWLGVWEHNTNAQAFYKACGYHPIGRHTFLLGTDEQLDDLLLKRI